VVAPARHVKRKKSFADALEEVDCEFGPALKRLAD